MSRMFPAGLVAVLAVVLPGAPSRATPPPRVSVGGLALNPADPEARARITDALATLEITLAGPEGSETLPARALGVTLDDDTLARWLRDAADASTTLGAQADEGPLALRVPLRVDPGPALAKLTAWKERADRPARDARLDPATGRVAPEQEGRALDVWASLDALHGALDRLALDLRADAEVLLVVARTPAKRTAAELRDVDVSAVLGTFETPYAQTEDARDRTHNLRVAAEKIDGHVLLPGEVFDFNALVGDRSLSGGFKPAPVIAGGELVDGVGGGACQIAGTLHAAAFFAGLEVMERHPHSRPSWYIKLGLDAAVSYPNLNLRFRNDQDAPVLLRLVVEGGKTRAEVRGARREELVTFVRRIDDFTAYEERELEDPELPAGVRVLRQRGVPGFRVTRWRVRRDPERNQARRQRMPVDTYPPTPQVWRVGTGSEAPEDYQAPEGDGHPEYTADEYTELSQGVGVDGTLVVRRAGRTGRPGWTLRAGMPPATPER
ncbi:MAG: VanW family protein [Myxococcota bacterium]